jgi:hypothetical protein
MVVSYISHQPHLVGTDMSGGSLQGVRFRRLEVCWKGKQERRSNHNWEVRERVSDNVSLDRRTHDFVWRASFDLRVSGICGLFDLLP